MVDYGLESPIASSFVIPARGGGALTHSLGQAFHLGSFSYKNSEIRLDSGRHDKRSSVATSVGLAREIDLPIAPDDGMELIRALPLR